MWGKRKEKVNDYDIPVNPIPGLGQCRRDPLLDLEYINERVSMFRKHSSKFGKHNNLIMAGSFEERVKEFWIEFNDMLLEGVQRRSYHAIETLLQFEIFVTERLLKKYPDVLREKDPSALIYASENEYNEFLKLFIKYEYTLPVPHDTNCDCERCQKDTLGETINRMSLLKALSNPMWIALIAQDPFLTLFKLCESNRMYATQDDSFASAHEELSEGNFRLCLKLLDEVKNGEEGACVMRHKTFKGDQDEGADLTFVNLAIDYEQKEVVAHPVTQQFVTSRVFDEIPNWKTSGFAYKVFLIFLLGVTYPITTILHILLPCKYCLPIANIARKPFIKFINGAASFITFLVLLAIMGASEREGLRIGHAPIAIEIVVFAWLLGFLFIELKQVHARGVADYLSCGWNCIDISMDALMLLSYITWIVMCFYTPPAKKSILNFVDGMFAIAIILSFFRVVYLCQITRYLGLLQLCLGKMVQVIFQFAFINLVVLFSFSVAMTYLYNASVASGSFTFDVHPTSNFSGIYKILAKNYDGYDGLMPTLFTLAWAGLGMADTKTLKGFQDGTFIQLWVNLLFIVYFAVSMIVLLNMLIALMNNSYEQITNNLDAEHKFSRTTLWLEHIGNEVTRPVPFNIVPTWPSIRKCFEAINTLIYGRKATERRNRDQSMRNEARKEYKELCDKLMERYMLKTYGYSIKDKIYPDRAADNDPFPEKVKVHFEKWKVIYETETSENESDHVEFSTEHFYTSDDKEMVSPNCNGFHAGSQV